MAPIAFSITWAKCSAAGAIGGALSGLGGAVITWCAVAKGLTGEVTIDTLGQDLPMLAGNLVAIFLSAIVCITVSFIRPQNYDWALMKDIPTVEADPNAHLHSGAVSLGVGEWGGRAERGKWEEGGGTLWYGLGGMLWFKPKKWGVAVKGMGSG